MGPVASKAIFFSYLDEFGAGNKKLVNCMCYVNLNVFIGVCLRTRKLGFDYWGDDVMTSPSRHLGSDEPCYGVRIHKLRLVFG